MNNRTHGIQARQTIRPSPNKASRNKIPKRLRYFRWNRISLEGFSGNQLGASTAQVDPPTNRAPEEIDATGMMLGKIGNIGYMVDTQLVSWQQNGQQSSNRPATFFRGGAGLIGTSPLPP